MSKFNPIREVPQNHKFNSNDTLVVFGELFQRGYANGVVDEAKKAGMNIVYSTVGRRDSEQQLRALTPEELAEKDGPIINIPLEAGFDMEPAENGQRPIDQLKAYGLRDWQEAQLHWAAIEQSREKGRARFRTATQSFCKELQQHIQTEGNIVFLHTMAGGFPRAKVVMPIANKVFKGIGDRYLSSELFWNTEIGKLCNMSFNEVTAETFHTLIECTTELRKQVESRGNKASYMAFGYHGNEILTGDEFSWYSYSPYLQGWAKLLLEEKAQSAQQDGVAASVFNVPEILTNSSSIFLGIEVVIYPLLRALQKIGPDHPLTKKLTMECESKLGEGYSFSDIDKISQDYLNNPEVQDWPSFVGWPQHNGPDQMRLMREASEAIIKLHKSNKDLMTAELSELVFRACGLVMLRKANSLSSPVYWIGHDLVTKVGLEALD